MKKKLSFAMASLLHKAPDDWGTLPPGVYCTNRSLVALEERGHIDVELRVGDQPYAPFRWEWRRRPKVMPAPARSL